MASEACCALGPVVTENYVPKGKYEEVAGLNTYITGSPSSTTGVILIYDIFGFFPQTFQGADRLAARLHGLVIIPDFFRGGGMPQHALPPDTEEKKEIIAKFRREKASFEANLPTLLQVAEEVKRKWPDVKAWGTLGLCWGGKLVSLASAKNTPFKASGQVHPAQLSKADAEAFTIPHICLPSKGEPVDEVKGYEEVLSREGYVGVVETFKDMHHGWMGARANLEDERNAREFERGYDQVAAFFKKHLVALPKSEA